MMLPSRSIWLFSLLTTGLLLSASKPEPPPKDPITITYGLDDAKNYMYFKKGSYWVYQHDITNEIDSQWVQDVGIGQSTQKGTEEWSKHITLVQETFYMDIRSNFIDGHGNKSYWTIWSKGQNVDAFPNPDRAYVFTKYKYENGPSGIDCNQTVFAMPIDTLPIYETYQVKLLTNYKLNNHTFDTVRVFRIGNDCVMQQCKAYCGGGKSDYYYAKGVGLIKIYNESTRWSDGAPMKHSWNLIRYKIVK